MKGSRDLYYWKYKTRTWIRESHKVTKKLVIDSILFGYVITIVLVMTSKMIVNPTLVVTFNWSPTTVSMLRGLENLVRSNIRRKSEDRSQCDHWYRTRCS